MDAQWYVSRGGCRQRDDGILAALRVKTPCPAACWGLNPVTNYRRDVKASSSERMHVAATQGTVCLAVFASALVGGK